MHPLPWSAHSRIHHTDSQLSAAGRLLYRGATVSKDGQITVLMADRQAAINELNKMQPGALAASRNLNANINAYIPAATRVPTDPAELAALLESFKD